MNYDTETEYAPIEDSLSMHRTSLNKAFVISENPNIINEGNITISPEQTKKAVLILSHDFLKNKYFLILFLRIHLSIMLFEIF